MERKQKIISVFNEPLDLPVVNAVKIKFKTYDLIITGNAINVALLFLAVLIMATGAVLKH